MKKKKGKENFHNNVFSNISKHDISLAEFALFVYIRLLFLTNTRASFYFDDYRRMSRN